MAIPKPALPGPAITVGRRRGAFAWTLWIPVSVVGAMVGAIVAWQIRSLWQQPAPASLGQDIAYIATLVSALIAAGAQWFFFRTFKVDADWWAPATAAASLVDAAIVVPSVLHAFLSPTAATAPSMTSAMIAGAVALGAAGLIVGAAQALVLRQAIGRIATLWIPATVVGGALAGAITTALASQLYVLPAIATISLAAAVGALAIATCQAPVILRILR